MATKKVKISSRGGARAGAGRPKGVSSKLSGQAILDQIEMTLGRPYAEQLVQNYVDCLINQDKNMIHQYDKLFLSKVVADKVDLDVRVSEDVIEQKRLAFTEALNTLKGRDNGNG
jgi:hypothetical protein